MRRGLVYMPMRRLVRTRIRIRIPVMHVAPTHDMHDASHPHFVLDTPPRKVLLVMLVCGARYMVCYKYGSDIPPLKILSSLSPPCSGTSLTSHPTCVTRALGNPASATGLFQTCLLNDNRILACLLVYLTKANTSVRKEK